MKKIIILLFMLIAFVTSLNCFSAAFVREGKVHTLRAHANDLWGDESDFLLVHGFKNAGKCKRYTDGLVLIRMPKEEREWAVALTAQAANRTIVVSVADNRVDANGYCRLRWINIK